MAHPNLRAPSVVATVAVDFTEGEVFTAVVEDFMEAGSEEEHFTAEERFVAERASVAAVRFEVEPAFAEERSTAVFMALASTVVGAGTE
ncbi:MAG TPA: hypothetical protein VF740_00110, partial [Candidatus Acidoferrum sp.]